MLRRIVVLVVLLLMVPMTLAARAPAGHDDGVRERIYDGVGNLVLERGIVPGSPHIGFERHHFLNPSADAARGGKPGPGNGDAPNDCTATQYKKAGWRWSGPIDVVTTAYPAQIGAALASWDDETAAPLVGTVTHGQLGSAGTFDNVNQFAWVSLGATSTIAVTTTWYYRGSGVAVESDAQYNTYYAWSTTGETGKMDVENIAAHELGHTFGLDHAKGKGTECLTMYAYANQGETAKRTLGVGDIRGIRALYGA